MAYTTINEDWGRTSEATAAIGNYCVQDAAVVLRLDDRVKMLGMLQAIVRTTASSMRDMWFRGNEIKVDQLLFRECHERGIVKTTPLEDERRRQSYQGATVLDPIPGLYGGHARDGQEARCIATLDFASLYPSIILAHNLDFMTFVRPGYVCRETLQVDQRVKLVLGADSGMPQSVVAKERQESRTLCHTIRSVEDEIIVFEDETVLDCRTMRLQGHTVVAVLPSCVRTETLHDTVFVMDEPGVLPLIVRKMLDLRASFRAKIKQLRNDPAQSATISMLDNAQKATKIIANSAYGYTCAFRYPLYCIGEAITWKARQMLQATKQATEQRGYRVIYGDTDSVMVEVPRHAHESFDLAVGLAKEVTQLFPPPVLLEFEKIYQPYLLVGRKMYAGRMFEQVGDEGVLDVKGVATKRRDCPRWCAALQKQLFSTLFYYQPCEQSPCQQSLDCIQAQLQRLLDDQVSVAELTTSRQMKKLSSYKNLQQPHLHVTQLKNKRCPGSGACDGERVPLIFVYRDSTKRYERAEDPDYAVAHNLPVDKRYYIERLRSVTSIFGPVLGADLQRMFQRYEERESAQRRGVKYTKQLTLQEFFSNKRSAVQ